MQTIKNIIFDFGGVFIEVDYKKTEKAFKDAGIPHFDQLYSQQSASPLFEKLETGKITPEQFYHELRTISETNLVDDQIVQCWNMMLGRFHPEAIEWLEKIGKKYRLFLFSNTNAIHHQCFTEIYRRQFGRDDFDAYFDKAYYSHIMGLRKPYREAFQYILDEQGISASETVFIDDTISNVEAAKEAGLQAIFLEPPKGVWELEL